MFLFMSAAVAAILVLMHIPLPGAASVKFRIAFFAQGGLRDNISSRRPDCSGFIGLSVEL